MKQSNNNRIIYSKIPIKTAYMCSKHEAMLICSSLNSFFIYIYLFLHDTIQTFTIVNTLCEFVVITWSDKNVRTGMSGKVISGPYFGNTLTWRITGINTVRFYFSCMPLYVLCSVFS